MTDHLQRLRAEVADWLASAEAEIHRLEDRAGVYRHVLARIDATITDAASAAEPETPSEAERRREKRDIRGAVLATMGLRPHALMSAPMLRSLVEQDIGPLTDSALARSLASLVGDGKVNERDGVFSIPSEPITAEAAK